MIRFSIGTQKKGCCLKLNLRATPGCTVVIKGYDHVNGNMTYFRLEMNDYKHKGYLYLPMPLTPQTMSIAIQAQGGGKVELAEPPIVIVLRTSPIPSPYNSERCMDLYRFCENVAVQSYFCKPYSELCPENLITSRNNPNVCAKIPFQIIEEDDNGTRKISSTPARVARPSEQEAAQGIDYVFIEISQEKRRKMSVYMCVAMLFHELGHYLVDTGNEEESDSFSRMIYFDRGYPKSEYIYSFTDVFEPIKNSDGSVNKGHEAALIRRLELAHQDILAMEQRY